MTLDSPPVPHEEVMPADLTPLPSPRKLSRRSLFALGGAGTLVLVAGGGVWRAADQGVFSTGQGPAYAPWTEWRAATAGPLNLVRAAILAANAHNTQPWLFYVTDIHIDVFADLSRRITLTDPFLSEMHIGLGCALENMVLTAPANGYMPQVTLLPDATDVKHVARIALAPGATNVSALYEAIPHRHTNRYPYKNEHHVAQATLDALSALNADAQVRVLWFTTVVQHQQVGDLMNAAAHAFVADTMMNMDDNRWYRATWQEVQQHRDGITLDAAGLSDFTRLLGKMLPPESLDQQNSYFLSGVATQVQTAGAFGMLAVPNKRDDAQRMGAGRLWQRMHLWATTQGVAMQPLNQMTELADREVLLGTPPRFGMALTDLVGDPAWQAIFTFRLGYASQGALLSPRRDLSDVLTA